MLLLFVLAAYSMKFYTNSNYIYQLRGSDSYLFGASSGGLSIFSQLDKSFRVLTSTEGLPSNWCCCLNIDRDGNVWVGTDNGAAILKADRASLMILPQRFFPSSKINTIHSTGDTVYIGTDGGLLFIDAKGTLADTSDDVRKIVRTTNGLVSDTVLSVATNKYAWIGTANGLSCFSKDFNFLGNYLDKQKVQTMVAEDSLHLYAGTNTVLYYFNGTNFDTLAFGWEWDVGDLGLRNDSLFIARANAPVIYRDSFMVRNESLPPGARINTIALIPSGWAVGLGNRQPPFDNLGEGVAVRDSHRYRAYRRKSIPSNRVVDVTVATDGKLYVAHGPRGGIGDILAGISVMEDDTTWKTFRAPTIPTDMVHRCDADGLGRVWFGGNWGGGVFFYDTKGDTWVAYNPGNSGMLYDFVWDVTVDEHNNMLVVAGDPARVIVLDSSLSTWSSLNPTDIGHGADMSSRNGMIYVATKEQGLVAIDTKNTLFETDDDSIARYIDQLPSPNCQGVRIDPDGRACVATEGGVAIIDSGTISGFDTKNSPLVNDDCLAIAIDRQKRMWVLTKTGISVYTPHFKTWQKIGFNENNLTIKFAPERLDNKAFLFDSTRNCIWMGSRSGLLKIALADTLFVHYDSTFVYPNPLTPADRALVFKHVPSDAVIYIYTIAGRKVEKLEIYDPTAHGFVWYNPAPKLSSGLYFGLIKSPTKGKKIVKFAVVK